MEWLSFYIIVMAGITFIVRYLFFAKMLRFRLNKPVAQFLSFTAPCILTAMFVPIVFNQPSGNAIIDPYLIAGLFGMLISVLFKNILLVVVLSMGLFALLNFL